jgi:hypothetical protein
MFVLFCRWCCVTSEGNGNSARTKNDVSVLPSSVEDSGKNHYKKLFNLSRILRDVFRKHHKCALQPRTVWRFVKFVAILWRIPVFRHEYALKPKTLRRFVKFVAILRRIPVFRHGCDLMDIHAQNTATYSYFSSRMCSDGYSSPEHCDVFLFFVTHVHWWIFKPRTLQQFIKFVEI